VTLSTRTALFGAYCVCLALGNLPVLSRLIDHSKVDDSASHVVLIPLVSLVLVWWDRRRILAAPTFARRGGAAVILVGAALLIAARLQWLPGSSAALLSIAVGALVVLWIGGFLLLFGAPAFRAALFPLLFLVFTVPIPEPVLAGAVAMLKSGSADAVATLFTLSGTPYLREGFVFQLPTLAIEVADACSGIRSSIALLLTSLLIGHLSIDRVWKRVVLVLVVIPLTILKNGIRIVTLTLLALHVDPSFLTGQLHHDGGIVFFLLALAMLAPIVALLSGGLFLRPARDIVARQG
jgi:exosortase